MTAPDRADLHIHSNASDGALDPAAVVDAAVAGGLAVMALADHDTTAGVAEAMSAADGRIRIVPAVELSTTQRRTELHILGYHVDPAHPALLKHAGRAVAGRRRRAEKIVALLGEQGVEIGMEAVLAESAGEGALGRPHVARALVSAGKVGSVSEAFDRWLADDGPAFVPTELLTPREAIELIHEAGGVAVWAHPPRAILEATVEGLAAAGLDGLECWRPRVDPVDASRIQRTAASYGLLLTGGSDWHGPWSGELGAFHVPVSRIEALLAAGDVA